jgi:hypothetical protein
MQLGVALPVVRVVVTNASSSFGIGVCGSNRTSEEKILFRINKDPTVTSTTGVSSERKLLLLFFGKEGEGMVSFLS